MKSIETFSTLEKRLSLHLIEFQGRAERLAKDDVITVIENVEDMIASNISEAPYETLVTAFHLGLGIAALEKEHFKTAAVRIGKLIVCRVLSEVEQKEGEMDHASKRLQ